MSLARKFVVLGPEASFSDEAARNYLRRTKQEAEIVYCNSIPECFKAVKEGTDLTIVPILNSTVEASWINYTLAELKANGLKICGEEILPIRMNLLGVKGARLEDITEVYTIEKAFQQCGNYLAQNLPGVRKQNTGSTSAAAKLVRDSQDIGKVAIGNLLAAKIYSLEVLAEDIHDNPNNATRFIVLGHYEPPPSGNDRTTLILEYKDSSRVGVLVGALQHLSSRGINLLYIQSVPNRTLDNFTFYLDMEGHKDEGHIKEALQEIGEIREISLLKIAGSYPRFAQ
ncbi:MAG: prephenate dehydratase domain-containing protein [Nanoarchaeota archaeon]|nr:prephenate dehydratase domain-containing protein [Nanoarchaeota archaeon]